MDRHEGSNNRFSNFPKTPRNAMINHKHTAAVFMVCVPQTGFGSAVKQTDRALENVFKCKKKIYKS
jgi:hypothetical protein